MPTRTWFTVKMREETNLVELGQMAKIPEAKIATTPKATTNKVATTSRAAKTNKMVTTSRAATSSQISLQSSTSTLKGLLFFSVSLLITRH